MAKLTNDLKVTDEELKLIQEQVQKINNLQMQVGGLEIQKQLAVLQTQQSQGELGELQSTLEEKYGKVTVNLQDGTIKENLLIKGNNLLALHSLKEQFAGKVKLIYIDPPYNTGNDGFVYNDRFNHSTWLTFMKNRLEIAKEFLREDGVIFVQCDDNEQAYLKVLVDQIFGRENFIGDLIRKTKSSTNDAKVGFNIQHENTLVYAKSKEKAKLKGEEKDLSNYSNPDNDPKGDWVSSDPSASRTNTIYPIKNPYTGQVD